jgi:hypothetical protein
MTLQNAIAHQAPNGELEAVSSLSVKYIPLDGRRQGRYYLEAGEAHQCIAIVGIPRRTATCGLC